MAKKTTPLIPADVAVELFELRNIVNLASFAVEARRVLTEVDQVAKMCPEVGATLSRLIYARNGWSELGDRAGDVLNDVRGRLDKLLDDTP